MKRKAVNIVNEDKVGEILGGRVSAYSKSRDISNECLCLYCTHNNKNTKVTAMSKF